MPNLSTGSTLLNLACADDPMGGFVPGKYFFIVGDSASGKTFLSMTCFAEAVRNEAFKDYRLIYDNIEDGMLMDLDRLFGEAVADRIEGPDKDNDNEPVFSDTIESFYFHLDRAFDNGQPFIYVLDSMDALDSEGGDKKFDAHKKAYFRRRNKEAKEGNEKVAGSYGMEKAKLNSEYLRKALKRLRETGSILIILSQTRDNVGSMWGGKTRAGGKALRFYATTEIWSSIAKTIKKQVNGKEREVGVRVELEVRKNRITGRRACVEIDIFPDYGIDDTGSCVDYLVEEKFWTVTKQTIDASHLGMVGTRDKIICGIEKKGLVHRLRELCGECWRGVEEACAMKRQPRYAEGKASE